jgi:hypothetical protein
VRQHIEEIKEEIKREGITDPTEYIQKQLKGLQLDPQQKQLLKECVEDKGAYQENI